MEFNLHLNLEAVGIGIGTSEIRTDGRALHLIALPIKSNNVASGSGHK